MKNLFFFLLLFSMPVWNYGQDSIINRKDLNSIEFSIGVSYLSDEYIMAEKQQLGLSGSFRLRFEARSRKYAVTPMIGFRNYQISIGESADNILLALRAGVIVDFNLYKNINQDIFVSNFLEVCYSNYRNFIRQASGYIVTNKGLEDDYETHTLYKGTAPSIVIGYKFKYNIFFMDVGYDIAKTRITYDNTFLNSLKETNPEIDEHPGTIFNSLIVHMGASIPFSKVGKDWSFL